MPNPTLFPKAELPRRRNLIRMHVIDAGGHDCGMEPGEQFCRFGCRICGAETDWETMPNITAARRGIPCHNCNKDIDMNASPNKTDPELWAAWLEFQATPFYANIISHAGQEKEGLIWSAFYRGYEMGKAAKV